MNKTDEMMDKLDELRRLSKDPLGMRDLPPGVAVLTQGHEMTADDRLAGYKLVRNVEGELKSLYGEFTYEPGKEYEIDSPPILCVRGFHFCLRLPDVFEWCVADNNTEIWHVEAWGRINFDTTGLKFCSDRMRLVERIPKDVVLYRLRTELERASESGSSPVNMTEEYLAAESRRLFLEYAIEKTEAMER